MLSRDKIFYNDLTIEIGSERQYLFQLFNPNKDEKRVWMVVKNRGNPVCNCRVIVEGLEYYFRNEWIIAPNGYDRKALKWDVRNEPIEGMVDITTKGSRPIEIVRARRIPNPHFRITYYDGSTGKTHHFLGKYKLRVKIEARTTNKGNERNIVSVFYDIFFDYESTLKIGVKEIERVALPNTACT